ncbi:MAG: hypothetical protein ISS55_00625 [Dehalococcoidales bacterium]|nr:hypothetical protein [Dehalococcoidales bacterium]
MFVLNAPLQFFQYVLQSHQPNDLTRGIEDSGLMKLPDLEVAKLCVDGSVSGYEIGWSYHVSQ